MEHHAPILFLGDRPFMHCSQALVAYFQKLSVFIFDEFLDLLPSDSFKRIESHSVIQVVKSIVHHYGSISFR